MLQVRPNTVSPAVRAQINEEAGVVCIVALAQAQDNRTAGRLEARSLDDEVRAGNGAVGASLGDLRGLQVQGPFGREHGNFSAGLGGGAFGCRSSSGGGVSTALHDAVGELSPMCVRLGLVKHLIKIGDMPQFAAAGIGGDLALFLVEMFLEGIGPAQPEIITKRQRRSRRPRWRRAFLAEYTRGRRAAANGGTRLGPGRGGQRRGRRQRGGECGNDHHCVADPGKAAAGRSSVHRIGWTGRREDRRI